MLDRAIEIAVELVQRGDDPRAALRAAIVQARDEEDERLTLWIEIARSWRNNDRYVLDTRESAMLLALDALCARVWHTARAGM